MDMNLKEGVLKAWLEKFLASGLDFAVSILLAFVVYFIGIRIWRLLRSIAQKGMEHKSIDIGVRQFVDGLMKVTGYIVIGAVILHLFGIQTSSVAAGIASVGLTAGLALQGALANFAGGVLILILKPFRVGDYIIEDTHHNEGTVSQISIFYTRLQTIENKVVVIPNGTLANASLTNVTTADQRMINQTYSIGYDDDIKKAKDILMELGRKVPELKQGTEVKVFVRALSASSVDLGLQLWVPMEEYWTVLWRLNEDVKLAFDANQISIPYQQIDIHTKE
jgi:small conductance mechanosensitive channel